MAKIPHVREKFDPGRKLVALKPFTFIGKSFRPGDTFDRTLTTTRRLQQLYDAHFIVMTDERAPSTMAGFVNSGDSAMLELSIMGIEELTEFLTKRGFIPRYGSPRVKLLQKAEELLKKERTKKKAA